MFTVSEDASGGRIDVELTRRTGFSRSHVAAAIRAGAAAVNGEPAKPSRILEPGDSVTYTNQKTGASSSGKADSRRPTPLMHSLRFHFGSRLRSSHQWRTMPSWDKVKVMNTLML